MNQVKRLVAAVFVLCALCHFVSAQTTANQFKKHDSVIDSMVSSLKSVKQKINSIFRHEPLRRQPIDILKDNAHVSDIMVKKYVEKKSFKPEWSSNISDSVSHIMKIKIPVSPYEKAAQLSVVDNQNFNIVNSQTFNGSKKVK